MVKKRGTDTDQISSDIPVAFTDTEKAIIKVLLDYGAKNPDRWVDCARLGKKVYCAEEASEDSKTTVKEPRSAVWNVLQRLKPKLESISVELRQTKSEDFKTLVYSLNPEDERKITRACPNLRPQRSDPLKVLYLGELGFGTRAYDPRAGKGLGYFLQYNKEGKTSLRDSLDAVILEGGVIPFVPEFYTSAIGDNSMALLGKKIDDKKEDKPIDSDDDQRLEAYLETAKMSPTVKEFLKKHVIGKIVTKTEAVQTSQKQLEAIIGANFDKPVHYTYGVHDEEQLRQLKEIEIVRHLEETAQNMKQRKDLEKDVKNWRKKRDEYLHEKEILDNLRIWLTRAVDYEGPKFRENVDEFLEHHRTDIEKLNKVSRNLGRDVVKNLESAGSKKDVERKIKEASESFEKVEQEIKFANLQADDLQNRIDAIKRVNEARGFFKLTKRVQLNAKQRDTIWATVAENYANLLKAVFPRKNFVLHPDQHSDIDIKDRRFRLEQRMNIRSNNPEKDSLKRMKEKSNLINLRGERVPDVYVTAHGTGMRHQPQPKYAEETGPGKYRDTPEINMLVKLGTFHSAQKLEYLLRNNQTKNWEVKRVENSYSSGAFIHTLLPDGRHSIESIPTENLIELGMIAEQLEEAKAALKTVKSKEKKTLKAKIAELESKFVKQSPDEKDLIKITILTDAHIGCPTWPGRPSNYTLMEAAIQYEQSTRLPDLLVMTEMLHGALTKPYWSDKELYKLTRDDLKIAMTNIQSDTLISAEEKNKLFSTLLLLEDCQTPIPSLDEQAAVFDVEVAPFAKQVIANGGLVVLASGNHAQKSSPGVTDEATSLSRAFSAEEKESLYVQKAKGVSFGAGHVPLKKFGDARTVYVAHRMNRGSDEIAALKDQTRDMNIKDELALAGDAHQGGAEYANRRTHVVGPGLQGWNSYVDEIGKQAGLRGIVSIYLSKNPKLKNYCRVDYVLDPTLEAGIKDQINIEKLLIEKYIPHPK